MAAKKGLHIQNGRLMLGGLTLVGIGGGLKQAVIDTELRTADLPTVMMDILPDTDAKPLRSHGLGWRTGFGVAAPVRR